MLSLVRQEYGLVCVFPPLRPPLLLDGATRVLQMFLMRGGGISPGELYGFSSADARTEGTRKHVGSVLLGAGAGVGGLQQHPPLGWLLRSRKAWFAARKGLPGCPQPRCKAGGFLPPADVARTLSRWPSWRYLQADTWCSATSCPSSFPFSPFPS